MSVDMIIQEAEKKVHQQRESNVEQLTSQILAEQEKLVDLIDKIESDTLMNKNTAHREALDELQKIQKRFAACVEKIELYKSYEQTLDVPSQNLPQIEIFNAKFL